MHRKIREKKFSNIVKDSMYALLIAESEDEINKLFDNIQTAEKG